MCLYLDKCGRRRGFDFADLWRSRVLNIIFKVFIYVGLEKNFERYEGGLKIDTSDKVYCKVKLRYRWRYLRDKMEENLANVNKRYRMCIHYYLWLIHLILVNIFTEI